MTEKLWEEPHTKDDLDALAAWLDSLAPPPVPKVGDTITDVSALTEDGAAVRDCDGDVWVRVDGRWEGVSGTDVTCYAPFTVLSTGRNAERATVSHTPYHVIDPNACEGCRTGNHATAPLTTIENREQLAQVPCGVKLHHSRSGRTGRAAWWECVGLPEFPLTVVDGGAS